MRILLVVMLLLATDALARRSGGSHSVRGTVTKKGTYVAPHRQTNPNRTTGDNWSTKGNVNPVTGKRGTKVPSR
jgi:hypothetical protein